MKKPRIMSKNSSLLNKTGYTLIVLVITVSIFLTQFIFRSLDDNRLTQWSWIFIDVNIIKIFLFLLSGIIIAYAFSRVSFPEHYPVIFLFLSSFAIGALLWKEPEVIVDASRYFIQAKYLKIYGVKYFLQEWGRGINAWTDLPLVPFLYGLIFKFLGEFRLYIQLFTTFLFSMTVVLTYKIGKMLWDEETGFFAGIALLGMPYLFTQVPLMLVDVPTMFFLTLVIFTFIKAMNRGKAWIVISSIAVFLAFFSKYSTWLMLSVLIVIFAVYLIQNIKKPFLASKPLNFSISTSPVSTQSYIYRGGLVVLFAGILIVIAALLKFDVILEQIKFLQEYQKPGLKRWGESFLSSFFYQIHPFITSAALYSFYAAFKKRDLRYAIISWLIILVIVLQIKRIRYIIIVFPMLALMASYGLREIRDKGMRRFIIACAVMSSMVVTIFVYLPFLEKMSAVNLKNAGQFLNSLKIEKVEVFTLPQRESAANPAVSVPILDLSTDKDIFYKYEKPLLKEWVQKSSVRFTWEYENPEYYTTGIRDSENADAVVVISDSADQPFPDYVRQRLEGYHVSRVFTTITGVFRYRTIVTVYEKISY